MVSLKEPNNENDKDNSDGTCGFGHDGRMGGWVGGVPLDTMDGTRTARAVETP